MKKKILFVIGSLGGGGAERSLINLLATLDPNYYDIDLLLFNKKGLFLKQVPHYINILTPSKEIIFLCNGLNKNMIRGFSIKCAFMRLKFILSNKKEAISLYHNDQLLWKYVWRKCVPSLSKVYDIAVAYMHSIPTYYVIDKVYAKRKLLWVHHDYSKLKADLEFDELYFKKADYVITISEICKEILCNTFPKLEDKFKVLLTINSPQTIFNLAAQFVPEEYVTMVKYNVPILLSIGRLNEVKGFDMAVAAAASLKKRGNIFCWFIIGEGKLMELLQKQIVENNLQQNFVLMGTKSNPYPYIKYANIIVQTSRNEGKSIVLDEAKVLCKPIVSTSYESVVDQIEDGKTGVLVNISAEGIAWGIQTLLDDKHLLEHLSSNLKNLDFNTTAEVQKYIEYFEEKSCI